MITKVQDIHLSDENLLQIFSTYWKEGNYVQAFSLLENNPSLESKVMEAKVFNTLYGILTELQNKSDPSFKADKIKVSPIPPSELQNGQIYFQLN